MWRKKLISRLFSSLSSLVLLSLFASGAAAFAQDPTGQPTPAKGIGKKPTPAKKPAKPEPLTVILTVLTEPPESSIYINGEQRGVTNAEGRIQFEKFPLGSYTVEARKDGYVSSQRGFQAGTEAPTLVFKLQPDVSGYIKQFDELVAAGKISGPDSPNAVAVVNDLAGKFPDRPELARMRSTVSTKLLEANTQVINKTIFNWRTVTRDEIAKGLDNATNAQSFKSDDARIQAQAAYFKGVLGLRDWLTDGKPNGEGTSDAEGLKTAGADLEKATQLDGAWAPAWYQLGMAHLNLGNGPAAEAAFIKATQLEPGWAIAYARLGAAYYIGGKYKESIDAYRKAIQLDSGSALAYAGLGLARVMKGEKDGLKDAEKALQLDSTSGVPHLSVGIILSQPRRSTKEKARAAEELKKAIQKNPGNLEFQNRLAEQSLATLQAAKK
ncbi:MAG TPA: tetratricopeptide repeat protein [Blastocatellia bacterium]|nr:tetratricopeptide repeat protein [Blastocatellia bacterium]